MLGSSFAAGSLVLRSRERQVYCHREQFASSRDKPTRAQAFRARMAMGKVYWPKGAPAAPIGKTIAWNNPNTGNYGTVTPVREGTSNTGEYCREFRRTIGGTKRYAVACRQGDGAWRMR